MAYINLVLGQREVKYIRKQNNKKKESRTRKLVKFIVKPK